MRALKLALLESSLTVYYPILHEMFDRAKKPYF